MTAREASVSNSLPRALTIAGSDSGAGAGIQADLKTFTALRVYGLTALTAVTAQNTLGVRDFAPLAPAMVVEQINAVLEDMGATAIKTGMLANAAIIEAVAHCLARWRLPLVIDPVMVARGGEPLLEPEAVETLRVALFPLATVVTPNLFEAQMLSGQPIETVEEMRSAARAIHALGPRHVIVKGGHYQGEPIDIYFDGARFHELHAERVETPHTHGTGCTFSAAITAFIARGLPVEEAAVRAKKYITGALQHAPGVGKGHGPVGHFWQWEQLLQKNEQEQKV